MVFESGLPVLVSAVSHHPIVVHSYREDLDRGNTRNIASSLAGSAAGDKVFRGLKLGLILLSQTNFNVRYWQTDRHEILAKLRSTGLRIGDSRYSFGGVGRVVKFRETPAMATVRMVSTETGESTTAFRFEARFCCFVFNARSLFRYSASVN